MIPIAATSSTAATTNEPPNVVKPIASSCKPKPNTKIPKPTPAMPAPNAAIPIAIPAKLTPMLIPSEAIENDILNI